MNIDTKHQIVSDGYLIDYRGFGLFDVNNSKDHYVIDLENGSCTCKGFYYKKRCKHIEKCKILNIYIKE